MQMEQPVDAAPRRGVPTWVMEAAMAGLVIAMGLVIIFGSRKLGSSWTSDGPGAGYFPFYIGLILCGSGLGILYQSVLGKKRDTTLFIDTQQLRRVLIVLVPALVYVGAIQLIGIYLASAIYIAGFMTLLGKYPPARSIVAAVVIAALFFLMFEVWFKVPLAKGVLHPLSFLGY